MKTAEEILSEVFNHPPLHKSDEDLYLEAMRIYAEQAIDRCAEVACFVEKWDGDIYIEYDREIDKESILDVKKKLK